MITLSIIKADTGGFVGHSAVHPDMMTAARHAIDRAVESELVIDGHVAACGDDISLIMTHGYGADNELIHSFAWDTFQTTTNVARELGLYGAGQAGHAHPARFDGTPRVVALGFQIHDGKLIGPQDLFADPCFDEARHRANLAMDYLRWHGPFEPHRLPIEDLEYTTMPQIEARIADRWEPIGKPAPARERAPAEAGNILTHTAGPPA